MSCIAAAMLVAVPVVGAQGTGSARVPASDRICDMSMRVITMQLVDRSGAPLGGAGITVRRVRRRATVSGAASMGAGGDYKILEDGEISDLRPAGEPFDVTFAAAGRRKRVRLVIGMDPARCHVAQKSGPTKVIL